MYNYIAADAAELEKTEEKKRGTSALYNYISVDAAELEKTE